MKTVQTDRYLLQINDENKFYCFDSELGEFYADAEHASALNLQQATELKDAIDHYESNHEDILDINDEGNPIQIIKLEIVKIV